MKGCRGCLFWVLCVLSVLAFAFAVLFARRQTRIREREKERAETEALIRAHTDNAPPSGLPRMARRVRRERARSLHARGTGLPRSRGCASPLGEGAVTTVARTVSLHAHLRERCGRGRVSVGFPPDARRLQSSLVCRTALVRSLGKVWGGNFEEQGGDGGA